MENNQNQPITPSSSSDSSGFTPPVMPPDAPTPPVPTPQAPNTEPSSTISPSTLPNTYSANPPTPPEPVMSAGQAQVFEPTFAGQNIERPLGVAGGPVTEAISGQMTGFNDTKASKPRRFGLSKKMIIPILAIFVVLGGSAGAYFGYYVPNQPDNIWKTALSRTGKGYDKLSDYAVSQFHTKNSGIKLDGNFKTSGGFAADGTFSGSTDKDNGEFTGSLSAGGLKIDGDIRLIKSSTSTPDVYFKVNGLQGLGDLLGGFGVPPDSISRLNGLNNKWYFIDHSLFNQLSGNDNSSLQVTTDDVKSILKAVGDAGKQNIFTSDSTKMAFTVKTAVGKEKHDGRNAYHFVAAVDKDNLKSYVTTLCNNLKNSNLKKFFNNDSQQAYDSIGCSTAAQSVNNFDSSRTADVWVDLHTKLISAIRITDPKNKSDYFEVGQDYQGGSKYPFDLKFHSQDQSTTSDASINLALDTKSNTISLGGTAKETEQGGGSGFNGNFTINISPNNTKVNVQKPAGAENILQLLNDLGFGQISQQGSPAGAKNTSLNSGADVPVYQN